MNIKEELNNLETIAKDSWYCRGISRAPTEYCCNIFTRYLIPGSILELGPAEGVMTDLLDKITQDLTIVEGAESFYLDLQLRFPKATVVHSLFENFSPNVKYDNIILGHVLEHVDDPVKIISLASNWLSDRGRILASVPNSQSLHRQAAVIMGLLSFEEELNESDLHHGHRRVFNPKTFSEVFHKAGLKIDANGGYWLKPISNSQIEANWSQQMLNAFLQLGESYPDIAGEIYIVASNAK
jgi:hypothetical protein